MWNYIVDYADEYGLWNRLRICKEMTRLMTDNVYIWLNGNQNESHLPNFVGAKTNKNFKSWDSDDIFCKLSFTNFATRPKNISNALTFKTSNLAKISLARLRPEG